MKNFEVYVDKLIEGMQDTYICSEIYEFIFNKRCEADEYCEKIIEECCERCIFKCGVKQWLLSEYVEPIVLTRFEYDLIDTNDQSHDRAFNSFATYRNMMDRGYFENIKDTSMTLKEILDNCEIIKENQR